ncbi:MocR-like pyridoxine biosynthesis transcription factor PdxR [Saccharothrix syringae]|uniref:MocR-like pyridoxine biosynthesis transcription factor PdxR n=1 Tax=Saccharothrix syringae TaxID=103733 RepID=UPI0005276339|nr:PLP-dependent aminotransferase family protein [Saccharothrix syringae]
MSRSKKGPVDRSTTGADFLQLNLADVPVGGLAEWLTRQLRQAIADGRLPVGSRLPATRVLAAELRVSRGVVTEAYQRLTEDGQVAGRGRAGTVVVAAPIAAVAVAVAQPTGSATPRPPATRAIPRTDPTAAPATGAPTAPSALSAASPSTRSAPPAARTAEVFALPPGCGLLESLRSLPARIDLSPGVPDLAAFPRTAWLRAERAVLGTLSSADFGYGDPRGAPAFRLAVATWLARNRGVLVDPDEVVIVAGVAQALALLARVLRADGVDRIAVEDPGSLGARTQLASWDVEVDPVPVDADGIRVDALRAGGASAVLLTPAHQFPTGVVLGGGRRRELVRWADEGGLVIEDDYDAEHRYDRPPVPALRSLRAERVCYSGSVSKLLAPALRTGWLLVPHRYREAVVAAKRDTDLGNAVLPQLVLARLMENGELERQLRLLRRRHRDRRDAMIAALRRHLPGAHVHGAAAGLHLMVTFDADVPDVAVAAEALARGVKAQPLSWHRHRPGAPGLVLGYAANTAGDIGEGVAVLGEVVRELR